MKIYFAPNTRAVRIVWLFEELGLPCELEFFKLGDASMRSPAYLAVHPQGRVPTLVDDKVTIFESGASPRRGRALRSANARARIQQFGRRIASARSWLVTRSDRGPARRDGCYRA
jgi:hypothetical protein